MYIFLFINVVVYCKDELKFFIVFFLLYNRFMFFFDNELNGCIIRVLLDGENVIVIVY